MAENVPHSGNLTKTDHDGRLKTTSSDNKLEGKFRTSSFPDQRNDKSQQSSGCVRRVSVRLITEIATVGQPPDRQKEISYIIDKLIDSGSFGVVYKAKLEESNETVAIKKVLQDRRFKNRELQIMRSLDHINIIQLKYFFFKSGQKKEELYLNLVLEYLPETVDRIVRHYAKKNQIMPVLYIKLMMYQLFRSLAYIHANGVCHRDIKPHNLLYNPETGVLKLSDFGSAKKLVKGEPNVSYICSRCYRAPELIFGATDYTVNIDLWSAGCVHAELLLGIPLFNGNSAVDQLVEIFKALGTPTREQIKEMNPNYTEFKFPQLRQQPWSRIFRTYTDPEAIVVLTSRLLKYTPSNRIAAIEACADPFFYQLRRPDTKFPNGNELPPLFNFTSQELAIKPSLNSILLPCRSTTSTTTSTSGSARNNPPSYDPYPKFHEVVKRM